MAESITFTPDSTASTIASVYDLSVRSSGSPRYVPIPSDESHSPCCSRKCPFAARPANRAAYFFVPSGVANVVISSPSIGAAIICESYSDHDGRSGAGFSLRVLVLARPNPRRLKPAPLISLERRSRDTTFDSQPSTAGASSREHARKMRRYGHSLLRRVLASSSGAVAEERAVLSRKKISPARGFLWNQRASKLS